ncbi:hypothetical protein [Arthrobacter caoxuetaonis]|uniref:Uncharacterized protein n=1 Tax=Arthrobacter caoxuetaonis TaxID=2886935 RepID=A0A9X1MFS2_9MICC|nr:hypothetical protein [Arthrobacter caoxuetaonis]MCC3299274.1 hypothetical protein [Arthrobacter caoxuetaonis]USQ59232.1 hypothetical protein NF551_16750 [Arthrobacter caoxuetaonis]
MTGIRNTQPNPLDLTDLGGAIRQLGPESHGIKGIGVMTLLVDDGLVRITVTHPDDTDVRELFGWDDGSKEVDARAEALSVLEDYIGFVPQLDPDHGEEVRILDGRITFTFHETIGDDQVIDPEDLASWVSDFAAIADCAVRADLASRIVERYEQG